MLIVGVETNTFVRKFSATYKEELVTSVREHMPRVPRVVDFYVSI